MKEWDDRVLNVEIPILPQTADLEASKFWMLFKILYTFVTLGLGRQQEGGHMEKNR